MCMVIRKLSASVIGLAMVCSSQAQANYVVSVEDDSGQHAAPLIPGATYNLNVVLSGSSTHFANDFTLTVSEPGLVLTNYSWSFPYITGVSDDISVPQATELPVTLTADTFADTSTIDARFSNFLSVGEFGTGTLLSFELQLPDAISNSTMIEIGIGGTPPDSRPLFITEFFDHIVDDIQSFYIGVPEPTTMVLFAIAGVAIWRKRRRRNYMSTR